jgi:NitT/TauT family transport system substrate-binding protein
MRTFHALSRICIASLFCIIGWTAQGQTKPTVRFHEYGKIILHLPNWVMIENGYCDKHGIKCEPVTLANAPLAQAAAAAGSVDIVNSTIDTTLQAIAKGNDLQIVGGYWSGNPYALVARAGLDLPNKAAGYPKNIADLKGTKVGVAARGSSTEIFMKSLLMHAGMPADSVVYIPVGGPVTAYASLATKQVDAVLSWDPVPALCVATATCTSLVDMRNGEGPASYKGLNSTSIFLQARREYVEKNPDRIDAFNAALSEAIRWINEPSNYPQVLALAKKNIVLGEDIPNRDRLYELMVQDAIPRFSARLARPAVQAWQDFLLENKVLETPLALKSIIYKNAP